MTRGTMAKPTAMSEALYLLRRDGPMHYRDLADAIIERGNVKPKGKTFTQTLSASLIRHPEVERVAPGVYKAKEEGDG